MLRFCIQRISAGLVVMLLVSGLVFLAIHAIPGGPVAVLLGTTASPARIAALEKTLHLDQPLYIQYLAWLWQLLHGNFGTSILSQIPVAKMLATALPVTLELIVASEVLALVLALPLGTLAAARPGHWLDRIVMFTVIFGGSVPSFWSGILLIIVFAVHLHWLPPSGFTTIAAGPTQNLLHMVLPVASFGFWLSAPLTRFVRAEVMSALTQDYVRTARGKGLNSPRIFRHALRNSLIPLMTFIGLQLGALLAGAMIVEEVFALPGVGRLALWGLENRDYPVVQAVTVYIAVGYVVINILVDIAYGLLNPRIRTFGEGENASA